MKFFKNSLCLGLSLVFLNSSRTTSSAANSASGDWRPNILLIITDDQRYDTMEFMPLTKKRIFDEGVVFTNAYITTPVCGPSRASILTGMYAHHHNVRTNQDTLWRKTFVERLHQAGYYTGLVGKYLNSWDGSYRPEFDFWAALEGGGSRYYKPRLNVNGEWRFHRGYITHILRDFALQFLHSAAEQNRPFLLILSTTAPHGYPEPAPGDDSLYVDLQAYRPPNYNEADVSDKPHWLQARTLWKEPRIARMDTFRLRQLQTLKSLDLAIDDILTELDNLRMADSTMVIFLSDNGYFWGEHRLKEKVRVYEPSSRVPFAIRAPWLASRPRVETRLVANIDLAPTFYELVGRKLPPNVDGRSLVPLLQDQGEWRSELLIEAWPNEYPSYTAIHTGRYVYVETEGDRSELYDLVSDPFQLENQIDNPAVADIVSRLQARLYDVRNGNGTSVESNDAISLHDFRLDQNYPNPFNASTVIRFTVPRRTAVDLEIYDVSGRLVDEILHGDVESGMHSIIWQADGNLSSGVYFSVLTGGGVASVKKMILVR